MFHVDVCLHKYTCTPVYSAVCCSARYVSAVFSIAADKERNIHWIQVDFDSAATLPMAPSSLSLFSDDTHILLLSHWLDTSSLVSLDAAVTYHIYKAHWMTLLRTMRSAAVDDWGHSYSSLMWLIRRGIRPTRMHLTVDAWQVRDCDLFQIGATDLVDIGLNNCINLTDQFMFYISDQRHGLRCLDVRNCQEVTDAGISALCKM